MSQPATPKLPEVVRLAHLSDIHVTVARLSWRWTDWFTKRATGWVNLRGLGRGVSFRFADQVLSALVQDVTLRHPDHVVFSGDASALGFAEEIAHAAELLGVGRRDALPGLAVPGNHDYYTRALEQSGVFERCFAPWQQGERIDGAVYPFAQRVGHLWLIGVNSCKGNRLPLDASGRVGPEQLNRLERLLDRLGPGLRILVTHYPVYRASGLPEKRHHGLRDLDAVLAVARRGKISLWLHGHDHAAFYHACSTAAPFPVICVGTATQEGLWSYGDYTISGRRLRGLRRIYSPTTASFEDAEGFELLLSR
jgi:3',5'-cyclic AMP phosphodiesterase CpdA